MQTYNRRHALRKGHHQAHLPRHRFGLLHDEHLPAPAGHIDPERSH